MDCFRKLKGFRIKFRDRWVFRFRIESIRLVADRFAVLSRPVAFQTPLGYDSV